MTSTRPTHAFSLVELSIVLVILGLLVGGVLAGQSLIRASQIRTIGVEANNYASAVYAFRDKYFGLPGDINNASSFWGIAHATPASCVTTTSTGTLTCNGDANGQIGSLIDIYSGSPSIYVAESLRAWQHLANAGLIAGRYTGVAGSAGVVHSIAGTNVPASRFGNGAWSLVYYDGNTTPHGGQSGAAFGFQGNSLAFGGNSVGENDYMNNHIIRADEAYSIDVKVDDGIPNQGRLRPWPFVARPNCSTATDTAYAVSNPTAQACNLVYLINL